MTIAELIAMLQDFDEDLVVCLGLETEELIQVQDASLVLVRRVGVASYTPYDSPDGLEVVALC